MTLEAQVEERIATLERGYILTHQGLDLRMGGMTREQWETVGRELTERRESVGWALVDWMMLHQGAWGERYKHVQLVTGYSYKFVSQLNALGEAYPPGKRVFGASKSAHRLCLSLPPEERLTFLQRYRDKEWSWEKLNAAVISFNAKRQNRAVSSKLKKQHGQNPQLVKCPHCQSVFPMSPNFVR